MASRLYELDVTVPAGTQKLTPVTTPFVLEDAMLTSMTIRVPPGHVGLTGIRVVRSSQQIIPWGNFSFLVMDNEKIDLQLNEEIQRNALVVSAYNTDIFNHTFYLRAVISDFGAQQSSPIVPVAASIVSGIDATPGTAPLAAGIPQSDLAQALAAEGLAPPDLTQGIEVGL